MTHHSLAHEFLTIENAPPGGGVPIVTLPTAPVAPSPGATLPTPPLPSPPSPVLPTPGIETADAFEFAEMVVGNPGSPAEAFELLGIDLNPGGGFPGISLGGERSIFVFDEGTATVENFPAVMGGAGGQFVRQEYVDAVNNCIHAGGTFENCIDFT